MRRIPDTPIYCTANGVKSLKGHYHQDWNFQPVKTGDKLSLGEQGADLHRGADAPLAGQHVLLSDRRQHPLQQRRLRPALRHRSACSTTWSTRRSCMAECIKYYANILTPFSALVTKKIKEVLAFNLPVDMICTSHGVIWRDNPAADRRASTWNGRTATRKTRSPSSTTPCGTARASWRRASPEGIRRGRSARSP